jgi:hypothetical protein
MEKRAATCNIKNWVLVGLSRFLAPGKFTAGRQEIAPNFPTFHIATVLRKCKKTFANLRYFSFKVKNSSTLRFNKKL